MADTLYIVLRRIEEVPARGAWIVVDPSVQAVSAESAIREAITQHTAEAGVYVAIPGRSFKPVQVQAVQTTVLKFDTPNAATE